LYFSAETRRKGDFAEKNLMFFSVFSLLLRATAMRSKE
jgi:hypothetical protein